MPSATSKDPLDTESHWHTVRYGAWQLSVFIYVASVPALVVNIVVSALMAFRGNHDAWIVMGGCVVMIAVTPLMALLIRHTMYWQVSATGLRYVNVSHVKTLAWDQIECVRRFGPFPLFFASTTKRQFIPKQIMLAPWLMESFAEFQRLISKYAPSKHVLVEFTSRGG